MTKSSKFYLKILFFWTILPLIIIFSVGGFLEEKFHRILGDMLVDSLSFVLYLSLLSPFYIFWQSYREDNQKWMTISLILTFLFIFFALFINKVSNIRMSL